jgi:hypothetical protein
MTRNAYKNKYKYIKTTLILVYLEFFVLFVQIMSQKL